MSSAYTRALHSRRRARVLTRARRDVTSLLSSVVLLAIVAPTARSQVRRDSSAHAAPPAPDTLRRTTRGTTDSERTAQTSLDDLIAIALERSPLLGAARARETAARARIRPAGTRADPNLMAGLITIPVAKPSLTDDDFTMLMVGIQQSFPYPGKRKLRTRAAALDADAAHTALDAARLGVVRAVKDAYFEMAYLDHALEIAARSRLVLADIVRVTESRYGTGAGAQQDVLKARVEAARLAESVNALSEARVASLAQLNAALDRPTDTPVERATIPTQVARASVAADAASISFTAQTLGARAAGSPLPPLQTLQDMAERSNPSLREHEARIAAQAARVNLARREYKPDIDVTVQYNHRVAFPDLLTAQVSIPLRLQKSSKQDQAVAEAAAELSALEADHRAEVAAVRARIVALVSDIEHNRTQLALYVKAILPQARGGATSALASYQAGRADLLTLLDHQNTVFAYETAYFRAQSDFARKVAELEQLVGMEVIP